MKIKWTDTEDIALYLVEAYPDADPLTERFTALRDKVLAMPNFEDDLESLNEGILETIQMAWLEEAEEAKLA